MNEKSSGEIRDVMKNYWEEHSQAASNVEMMLDNDADVISEKDIEDVQTMVPEVKGKRILELGAGIGRYTTWLVDQAEHVVAVDFIEKFIESNRETNESKGNAEFLCADATKLEFEPECFDVVFSNWLLMYLTNAETSKLLEHILSWLKPGGYLFFRESCNKQSGNKSRDDNPTIYRKMSDYDKIIHSTKTADYSFELQLVRSNQAYVDIKKNPFQLCWLVQKKYGSHATCSLHELLDTEHYSKNGIQKLELLFGRSSADDSNRLLSACVKHLDLKADDEVLEVGCGLGSAAFYLAEKCAARVYALDLSANMIEQALETFDTEYKHRNILFELADVRQRHFEEARFDAVYCQDTIPHFAEKKEIFDKFLRWLKPGGRLCVASLCHGADNPEAELSDYLEKRDYHLVTSDYVKQVHNESSSLIDTLEKKDLVSAEQSRNDFVAQYSEEEFQALVDGVKSQIKWLKGDQLQWIVLSASK